MRRGGGGRRGGRTSGQRGGQSVGRGSFGIVSRGLNFLSDMITRRQNANVPQRTAVSSNTNRLVAAVMMDKCCFCGVCQQVCPQGAIVQGQIVHIDADRCTGCGQCVMQCSEEALVLKRK